VRARNCGLEITQRMRKCVGILDDGRGRKDTRVERVKKIVG
jgi:hypothetical protein